MPKSFTDAEKEYIRNRLIHEAETCLSLYGVRKTTVDELVRRVGIPKGTFYLFYTSKEALIFDVILKINASVQQELVTFVSAMHTKPDVNAITELIFQLYHSLGDTFLLKLINNGELEFLMQKAPPEFLATNILEDDMMTQKLLSLFPDTDPQKSKVFSAAMRAVFLMLLHKQQIAYEPFDDILHLTIRGIVLQMFGA